MSVRRLNFPSEVKLPPGENRARLNFTWPNFGWPNFGWPNFGWAVSTCCGKHHPVHIATRQASSRGHRVHMTGTTASRPPLRHREAVLIVVLASLTAFGPMSIDMYLSGLPTIAADFGASAADTQLTLSAFFLGFGGGQLIYGPLSDRFGRRRPLLAGLVLFTFASIGCAFAGSLNLLIAMRFLQAIGGCAGPVIARAMVRDLYGRDRAARVLSLMVLIMGIAPIVAPLVGSQILYFSGWRTIFWIIAGFGLACALATIALLRESLPPERRTHGGAWAQVAAYAEPLTHLRFIGYAMSGALVYGGMFVYITGSPFVVITLFGFSPTAFSQIFALNVVGFLLGAGVNSRMVMRVGVDRMLGYGVLGAAGSGAALAFFAATGWGGPTGVLLPLFAYLTAIGLVGANAMAGCLGLFPTRAGVASALAGTLQFLSGTLLSALLSMLNDGTAVPMAGIIAAAGIASLFVQRMLTR
jgi:MFS transporter, DHA1 family, multidrug resistance protein